MNSKEEKAFLQRGLDPEWAVRLGARFENGLFQFDYLRKDNGKRRLLFRKFRKDKSADAPRKFWIEPSGICLSLWLLDRIQDLPSHPNMPLVITEGEMDAIAALQSGISFAVSVPNGAPGSKTDGSKLIAEDTAYSYLWTPDNKLIPEIEQFDKVILAVDGDNPGLILRDELALRIGKNRCWFVVYPQGCKDLNDVLVKYGSQKVIEVILEAKPMRTSHLVKFCDLPPAARREYYECGWYSLANNLKLTRPELVVVTGVPGDGKGIWTRNLCCNLAEEYGLRVALFIPEDRDEIVYKYLINWRMRNYVDTINNSYCLDIERTQEHKEAKKWVDDHFMLVKFSMDEEVSIDEIEMDIESAVWHHNCQIFVIDPWNEIDHVYDNETKYIGDRIRRLKRIINRLHVMLFIIAHPRKISAGEEATGYAISGSANWKNKTDAIIVVAREKNEDGSSSDISKITIERQKIQEEMGKLGSARLRFNPLTRAFTEV